MAIQPIVQSWIDGVAAIVYQRCRSCDHFWYFGRAFCPACGRANPESLAASGQGRVHALSLVHRAPSEALRSKVPYMIVMVDADEGFRLMAQGDQSLRIGDRVQARFTEFGGRIIPYFERI